MPTEDMVRVEESDDTDSKDNSDEEVDENIAKSVVDQDKDKDGIVPPTKKATTKGVLIKKLGSASEIKRKRDETQDPKGLGPTLKTIDPLKSLEYLSRDQIPVAKHLPLRSKRRSLLEKSDKRYLKPRKF